MLFYTRKDQLQKAKLLPAHKLIYEKLTGCLNGKDAGIRLSAHFVHSIAEQLAKISFPGSFQLIISRKYHFYNSKYLSGW